MAEAYDVVVVGSGASGGWVAKDLTEAGLRVAVLEAGRKLDPAVDYGDHKHPYDMPLRGTKVPAAALLEQPIQKAVADEYTSHLFVKDTECPYTTPADRPFVWIRGRHVGGKSIMWGRQTYRLSDYDLKAASRDGFGVDWPLEYAELAPYYDRVERFIGVSGQPEGLKQLPDGQFLPPMRMTCGEQLVKEGVRRQYAKDGRLVTIGRCAILTVPLNGRPACHYCGPCERGCTTGSYYSSPSSTLPAAARTGRLTVIPNAVVSHVAVDDNGKCKSVAYVDRIDRSQREVAARVVVLCASTLETTRIMLNSRSARYPNGIANSSGVLGHYLMDHVMGGWAAGTLPVLKSVPDDRARRPNGVYVPRFRNLETRHPDFIRGYGFQGGASREVYGHAYAMHEWGPELKRKVRENRSWQFGMGSFGECLPRFENYCELDKNKVDAWGIPILHVSMAFGDNERKMLEDAKATAEEMVRASGAENVGSGATMSKPGEGIHEVGSARMGTDPKTSVVNRWQQAHDTPNLFLMDGSVYPSSACQNPTITIMALAARACDYLVEQTRRGDI